MENPFLRRAAEFLRDDEAFLAVVSPDPVTHFLSRAGRAGTLYDRLVPLRGTPGSGKTTLARLFEFPTIHAILRNRSFAGYKELTAVLSECGAIHDGRPRLLGCRLPLETDYRDFWESPYAEELKSSLMTTLLQARSVLAWFRHLRGAGIDAEYVEFQIRAEAQGLLDTIGGYGGKQVRDRAAAVENAIYKVMTSLVAPPERELPPDAVNPYRPFDIIDRVGVPGDVLGFTGFLIPLPLAIFDDAHVLHPAQFRALERFLVRRELRIARWMIARIDVLLPEEALAAAVEDRSAAITFPGASAGASTEPIFLQSSGKRREERERFRVLAKDMARRYLRRMPLFSERGLTDLANVLGNTEVSVTPGRLRELEEAVSAAQTRLRISDTQRHVFEGQIRSYWGDKSALAADLSASMLHVMMHRYEVRRGRAGASLFEDDEESNAEASVVVAANDAVYEAAVFQLFQRFG